MFGYIKWTLSAHSVCLVVNNHMNCTDMCHNCVGHEIQNLEYLSWSKTSQGIKRSRAAIHCLGSIAHNIENNNVGLTRKKRQLKHIVAIFTHILIKDTPEPQSPLNGDLCFSPGSM